MSKNSDVKVDVQGNDELNLHTTTMYPVIIRCVKLHAHRFLIWGDMSINNM